MKYLQYNMLALLIGFVLDLLIGDPEGWPHPVIWIGRFISFMEKKRRARGGDLRRGAVLLTVSTVLLTMLVTAAVVFLLALWGDIPLLVGMSLIAWLCLAAKSLYKEGRGVEKALAVSLEAGRKQVGRIVGRDTRQLSEPEIIRAAVETVAENAADGVIAPMLFFFVGGPVLAMGFKAASTLDSMVGYLDEKYRDIGWSSARLDDILNFIPARLCGPLLCLAASLTGLDGKNALRIMKRDHANHLSPNCAWSEAAAAGALHIRLGGSHEYFGKRIDKPSIGDDDRPCQRADIRRTGRMMLVSAALFAAILCILVILGSILL